MKSDLPLLEIKNLTISFGQGEQAVTAVENLDITLQSGETLGIVGESGSGKSVTSLAIMGLLAKTATIAKGSIQFRIDNEMVNLLDSESIRKIRGKRIAMIFQEPMTSLNPVHTCGDQVAESIRLHMRCSGKEARLRVLDLFEQVNLPRPVELYNSYPHQLSGGQKQRIMIAMALSCNPDLIIADEPTTALDVTVQKKILQLLKELCEKNNTGLIFITHDLGVVAEVADNVCVMYRGKVLEKGPVSDIFTNPENAYTKALLACRPRLDKNPERLPVVADFMGEGVPKDERDNKVHVDFSDNENLLEVKDLNIWFPSQKDWKGKPTAYFHAVDGVSFNVKKGETLGLVGESGCGKTTLGRAILKLVPAHSGEILFDRKNILPLSQKEFKPLRKRAQLIFQDPYASLNPRYTVGETLLEPMKVHRVLSSDRLRRTRIDEMMDYVGLPQSALKKYPHEFSGGQRQRICIARALVIEPEFIVCDESVSALDVSVQAQVLNLLNDLKVEFGLTYIFISHDLSVVKYMSDRLVVMRRGKIEEQGFASEIYANPQSAYTRELIEAIPVV
ncbi:ABC transporter ATP-binding protein [Cryomorpha ignava]|uniref:ABC transporter ATP-binding protein n=1 Tax=Cryomorpha ignava TaxID=101383 RepID=A0A7K3WW45_9FLAO|nr:ABC transporter ATP-binding protein [Cryomorpha ignava]NEN25271.1 ABC transporter ATP-binding protein [Cryomorpha ignava]